MAGKAARVAVEPSGSERDTMEPTGGGRHRWASREAENGREHMSQLGKERVSNARERMSQSFRSIDGKSEILVLTSVGTATIASA